MATLKSLLTIQHDMIATATTSNGGTPRTVTDNEGGGLTSSLLNTDTHGPSKKVTVQVTLVAGAKTIDLTSLTDMISGATVTLSGLKIVHLTAVSDSANTTAVRMKSGASNGFIPSGSAFDVDLPYGGTGHGFNWGGRGLAVDATHKNIDFAGSGTETLVLTITAGP